MTSCDVFFMHPENIEDATASSSPASPEAVESASSGYTLLELSVVLLVIALLVSGVMIARTLTRAAQLQAAITEYDLYLKAIQQFQDQYLALPGDMAHATSFWGIQSSNCSPPATDYTTAPVSTNTCNGDGNGQIGWISNTSLSTCALTNPDKWCAYEAYLAWQHLSNAGLIEGRYNGRTDADAHIEIGLNAPASNVKAAGWTVQYIPPPSSTGTTLDLWDDRYGHVLVLGGGNGSRGYRSDAGAPVLTPKETLELDTKMDDGSPGTGKMRHWRSLRNPDCVDSDSDVAQATMIYKTDGSAGDKIACTPLFVPGF